MDSMVPNLSERNILKVFVSIDLLITAVAEIIPTVIAHHLVATFGS